MREVDNGPRAAALIEGMRDFGYTLESALADIIDNSITAGANHVEILSEFFGDTRAIAVVDDGSGMSEEELIDALRLGSTNPLLERAPDDLGRFGLGLKSASFSQCRRLTVVTRRDDTTSIARWDLDRVSELDEWKLELPDSIDGVPFADRLGEQGTVVLWEKLDRLLDNESDAKSLEHANGRISAAIDHLELVFHRFIGADRTVRTVEMAINGRPLKAFDPFNSESSYTQISATERIRFKRAVITVTAYTLPHHSNVSAVEWDRYAGREGYTKNQGFYVYRSGRLIIHGTWFGLMRQGELTKLTRVKVDLPNSLDADWKIDVRKASAQPPRLIREKLQRTIEAMGRPAVKVHTKRSVRVLSPERFPVWERRQAAGKISFAVNREHPVIAETISGKAGDQVARAISLVEASLPLDALLADLSGTPEQVVAPMLEQETLRSIAMQTAELLRKRNVSDEQIRDVLLGDPFRTDSATIELVLAALSIHLREDQHD
jgi:hypothetical protein